MRRRWALAVLAGAVALLATGCQVTIAVGVNAKADGSGTVTVTATMDKDAASQAGQLSLDDLRQAGWVVDAPRSQPDGSQVVKATKAFSTAGALTEVMAELTGDNGPFHDFRLTRDRSLVRTRTSFSGTVDLSGGLGGFADDDLRKALGVAGGVGLDPAAVKQQTGVDLDRIFTFSVAVRLPGSLTTSNAPAQAGNGATWQPVLGDKVTLTASSSQYNRTPITLLVVAGAAALALLGVLAYRLFSNRR